MASNERAVEREGLLGDASTATISTTNTNASAAINSMTAKNEHQANDEGQRRATRPIRYRWREGGVTEPPEESAHGGSNRAELAAAAVAGTTTTAPGSRPRSRPIFDPNETTANSGTASPPSDKTKQLNVSPGLAETTCRTFLQADKNHRKIFRTENDNPRNVLHIESSRKVPREQSSRKVLRAVAATLVVAALLCLAAVLAAVTGVWNWRDTFPYRGPVFNAVKNCRKVHTGPEEPCSNILESTCFDRDRCRGGGGRGEEGGSFSVYVHDETCSRRSSSEGGVEVGILGKAVPSIWSRAAEAFRRAAESRGVLVETPEEACVVVYVVPTKGECVSKTSTWENGQNHLLVDMNDQTREERLRLDHRAMFAEANMRPCYFRYGYDIAIPLLAKSTFQNLRDTAPQDRKYFATFKGSLYLSGNGFSERTAVRNLGEAAVNDTSVVVVEHCQTRHKEHLQSRNKDLCQDLQREYDKTDYGDLMNTTFALIPAGRSPATYRLGEALSAGAIPVFIHQNFVKPFPGKIPWSTFSFAFPAEESSQIINTLRRVPVEKLAEMQITALKVFDHYFGREMNGTVHTTLDILEERLSFHGRTR